MEAFFPEYIEVANIKYYKKSKKIQIYLTSKDFIKQEFLDEKVRIISEKFEIDDVEIIPQYVVSQEEKEKLILYSNILRVKINSLFPSTKELNGSLKIDYVDDRYEIIITKSPIYSMLISKNAKQIIEESIKSELSLDIKCELILQEDNLDIEEYIKNQKSENSDILNDALKPKIEEKSNKNTAQVKKVEIKGDAEKISSINGEMENVIISGQVYSCTTKDIKNDKKLMEFVLSDDSGAIYCKKFLNQNDVVLSNGQYVKISGNAENDSYKHELVIMAKKIQEVVKIAKKDLSQEKMVELHVHTNMSQMDGLTSVKELMSRIKSYEHCAVAITDHAVVQAFPDVMEVANKQGVKPIYGCEFYVVEDTQEHIKVRKKAEFDAKYVVFDLETTGFSNRNDAITEIGAIKVENGEIVEEFSQLINPERPIPEKIQKLTGITNEMVLDKPTISEVLPKFLDFCKDSILVAHNSDFDTGFVREKASENNLTYDFDAIDTVILSRLLMPDLKNHKLNTIAKELNVSLENHHRAVDDATATAQIFLTFISKLKAMDIDNFNEINEKINSIDTSKLRPSNVVILAKNQAGIKDLYKLVSLAHTKYLYSGTPTIPKSEIKNHRENLLVGSGFYESDVFSAILKNKPVNEIESIVDFYDYIEINPVTTMNSMINDESVRNVEEIKNINKTIYQIATKMGKTVIASSNSHYLDKEEQLFRKILKSSIKKRDESPDNDLYLRTTDEMLQEFSYLGEDVANKIVVENTNAIANMIEEVIPVPDGTFPPVIEGSDEELRNMCYEKAKRIYSDNLPEIVEKRLDKELNSIISNGYAVMYIIAQKLVTKSLSDGYLVGSRGSVGSSLAAYMSDITEVNALPPHYICPKCKNSEFILDGSYPTGADMPDKDCPICGEKYYKDGFDIPFETFLGFEGDKEPDIDLNFAGEYQPNAHKYTQKLFGEDYVYRAGTIGTVAEKTAYGFIKKYEELKNEKFSNAQIEVLQKKCTGIKRTTGQHPGGVMVVPDYKDIFDFSPIQYPANDKKSGTLTTHFDYHSISGRILKLDILGHDGPSIIRQLEEFTDTDATKIPLDDKLTMGLFANTDSLGCKLDEIDCLTGTLGIPEFGTKFVRQMLIDTKPGTLGELVRISGLSHGTNVWVNNAQDLVRGNVASLKEVICTRDDIMNYLILKGLKPKTSFKIMENVRKGKGLTEEYENDMKENKVPQWYIDSCKKIEYMFPKAHAAAYVMLSFRIAYYKIHYPEAFYATYFTTKVLDFDVNIISKGQDAILEKIREINSLGNDVSVKEKALLTVLEVAFEMCKRNIKLEKVDLYKSDAKKFKLSENNTIIPPFLAIPGLGDVVAEKIYQEAKESEFISVEDLKERTGASKTVIEELTNSGCIDNLSNTNQLTFNFSL
ncbi:DNA polymerase-3 subunit alpha [[Eubacterium] yurii]|nr:DNA polymerase-3 subunit alpha [[Eubacterium] yurii]